jgi:hypothetical protein
MDHRYINHRFTGVREILVILAQSTILVKPTERARPYVLIGIKRGVLTVRQGNLDPQRARIF